MHKLDTTSGHLPYYKQIKEFYKKDIQERRELSLFTSQKKFRMKLQENCLAWTKK